MKKILLLGLVIICIAILFYLPTRSKSIYVQEEYVPNEVLVKFKRGIDKSDIRSAINSIQAKIIINRGNEITPSSWEPEDLELRSFRLDPDLLHIKVPDFIGTEYAIFLLNQNPIVEYAEENSIGHVCETVPEETKNPDFYRQWALKNTGQGDGTEGADIKATFAWDYFTGSSDIVVAVIDTGVNYGHMDLDHNAWINPGEINNNGIDDDNNGYIDDIHGWDFVDWDRIPADEDGHGTHCAGIIGAEVDNYQGIVGVCWQISIMALRAGDENGDFEKTDVVKALDYATENGAHLSNNSYGWSTGGNALKEAYERARDWNKDSGGKLIVAAAGNDPPYEEIVYPAKYNLENIISVLATNNKDELAGFSKYHQYDVDLAAPGGTDDPLIDEDDIYSTIPDSPWWAYKYGTSMAAPHVAGVAALIWGKPPKTPKTMWQKVKEYIFHSVDELPSLTDKCATGGRLNAYTPFTEPPPSAPTNLNATATAWTQIRLCWTDNSDDEIGFEIQRKKEGENDFSSINAVLEDQFMFTDTTATAGITHYYRVRSYNLANSSFTTDSTFIPISTPAAPTWLRARSPSPPDGVSLSWYDNSNNELGFVIERKSLSYPIWEEYDLAGPNATTYFDEDVEPGETYWYRVKSWNPIGDSGYSNEIQVVIFDF